MLNHKNVTKMSPLYARSPLVDRIIDLAARAGRRRTFRLSAKIGTMVAIIIALFVGMHACASSANAATGMEDILRGGDITAASSEIQDHFSWLLKTEAGVAIDWSEVVGTAGSPLNIAVMTAAFRTTGTPLAMIQVTAYHTVEHLAASGTSFGNIPLDSTKRRACVVGAMTGGLFSWFNVTVAQDERQALQALAYSAFDNTSVSHPQALQHLLHMTDWTAGAGAFDKGYQQNLIACRTMAA